MRKIGVLAVAGLVVGALSAHAATFTWDGETDGSWSTAGNWDTTPTFAAGNEFVFYASGAPNLNTFLGTTALTIGGLTFTDDADSDVTIRTYSNDTGSGGTNRILTFNGGAGNAFINIATGSTANIYLAIGGGRITTDSTWAIDHNGTGDLRFGQWIGGAGGIVKNGEGTMTFGSTIAHTYSGGLTINAGGVRIHAAGAFGTNVLRMTGGALFSGIASAIVITNNTEFSGNVRLGDAVENGQLTFNASYTTTLMGNLNLDVASTVTFGASIGESGGSYSLTKTGAGTLILGGNNSTFSGGLNINGGVVSSGNAGGRLGPTGSAVSMANGASLIWSGGINAAIDHPLTLNAGGGIMEVSNAGVTITWNSAVTGTGSLTKTGAGKLTLSGSPNTFGGGLFINGGTLSVVNADNRIGASGGAVSFDGGILQFVGTGVDATTSDRATTLNAGGGSIDVLTAGRTITWAGLIGGSGALTKLGEGTLTLDRENTYSGNTLIETGTLRLGGLGSISNTPMIHVAAGATFSIDSKGSGGYQLAAGQALTGSGTVNGTLIVGDGGILAPGSSPGALTNANLTWAGAGVLNWEVGTNSIAGVEGVDWDFLNVSETFALTATSGDPFVINILSWNGFVSETDQTWKILSAGNLIEGFNASAITLNDTTGAEGSWGISADSNNLYLTHTIPEPTAMGLMLLTFGIFARRRWARDRS